MHLLKPKTSRLENGQIACASIYPHVYLFFYFWTNRTYCMSQQHLAHEDPFSSDQFSPVQSLSCIQLFATPWTAARQTSLSITNSQSLLKLMPIEMLMLSNHLIFCRPLPLPPSIFPSIMVFSNESALHIRWPKYWSTYHFAYVKFPHSNSSAIKWLEITPDNI